MIMKWTVRILLMLALAGAAQLRAQTNNPAAAAAGDSTNATAANVADQAGIEAAAARSQRIEALRNACIQGRRTICGRIIKVLPGGVVVDSGYTNLLRAPLTESWLVPGTATASRPEGLVEGQEPGTASVGKVFLTDFPKRPAKPKLYDYVIIEAYPAGNFTYATLGTIHHTVRRFSALLPKAMAATLQATNSVPLPAPAAAK